MTQPDNALDPEDVAEYVQRCRDILDSNPNLDEENTKMKIVFPLFKLLGWDPLSTEVEAERKVQMGATAKKVDFALLLEETPVAFVETKGAESNLSEQNERQLQSYMRQDGVDWGLLTNGESFQVFQRIKDTHQPDERKLASFYLDEMSNHTQILGALSRESIKSGESDVIAQKILQLKKAAGDLEANRNSTVDEVAALINDRLDGDLRDMVEKQTESYVDQLIHTFQQRAINVDQAASSGFTRNTEGPSEGWTPGKGKNAISGTVQRADIQGDPDAQVAVFPSKPSGVEFLKENNAWGFVRISQNPEFAAFYISDPQSQIKYFARVKRIVDPEDVELSRPLNEYLDPTQFKKERTVVVLEPGSLKELADPIPYEERFPQSLQYITLGELRTAQTTGDVL